MKKEEEGELVEVLCPKCLGSGKESFYVGMRLAGTGKMPMYNLRHCLECKGTGKIKARKVK